MIAKTGVNTSDPVKRYLKASTPGQTTVVAGLSYTPYGHRLSSALALIGFNGEYLNSLTHQYLLGSGRRVYAPALMRFLSPDVKSPFHEGGINAYAYCAGDPVNRIDPSGQSWLSPIKGIGNLLGLRRRPQRLATQRAHRSTAALATPNAETSARSISEPNLNLSTLEPTVTRELLPSPPTYIEAYKRIPLSTRQEIIANKAKIKDLLLDVEISGHMNSRDHRQYVAELDEALRIRDQLWNRPINVDLPSYDELFPASLVNEIRSSNT
ncbi:RHS repeat-associated core domain-containing protein [Pseudomonas parafulva]|uniref:RHS repeat-associated core domain-containing protein n=1 Tax=Pseudomonas parafulva TaxID=157782 RepID=UPI0009B767A5|nr:RHS repeat-associated core domain-containing protein [Pseudomonas parafulva]